MNKIAQQSDQALSGWSQFPLSGAECLCTSGWSWPCVWLDSRTQGDVFVKFPPPHTLPASLPLCWGEICWYFLGGCWFGFILVYFVHAGGQGERERGSAGPGGSLQDGFLLPACPAAAGEGFRLCNFTPHFLKRWSEAAADPNTSIFPRMVKSLFLTLGLEPHQVVPEAALQPVQVPALTAWCHCQAWPHVPVTLRDVGQHQPHPQPPLIFILLYFHS